MRTAGLGTLVAAVALAAACSGGEAAEVFMSADHRFVPETLRIAAGVTVTFVNDSREPHSVTAYQSALPLRAPYFSSGGADSEADAREEVAATLIEPGGEFRLTLARPGTYRYFCIPHEDDGMKAEIVVQP